ncbi:hypothetical protein FMM08_02605 [Quadrisphaera setariae]|uniref:Uncharacterized protein n=1 Tax=Quadrisphaera setariae TaxID=2593304 RepID=A0A5C8ZM80_9ACTN|nr:hypothetical protein FMM08_02605 [Quadrisphaera setariae]
MTALTAASATSATALARPADRERGDVPGWVLVTVMTAGIVVGLAAVAQPMLVQMFQSAISAVTVK